MSFHDAEGWQRRNERHDARIAEFVAGKIGEPTLRKCLIDLGYRGYDIAAEIARAKMQKREREAALTRNLPR